MHSFNTYLYFCVRTIYLIAVALTAAVFLSERKSGLFDRSMVAGMNRIQSVNCGQLFHIEFDY
jgi:hypothetical protein